MVTRRPIAFTPGDGATMMGLMLTGNAITRCLMAGLPTAAMVLAQSEVVPLKETKRWVPLVVALLLVILIGLAACINPKRGHRD